MNVQLEIPFNPIWQTEVARRFAEGTEHTMGRVIGVILQLHLHTDPHQCTAVFVGLRWKNPRLIGHRNVTRDHWDHSIIHLSEQPDLPPVPITRHGTTPFWAQDSGIPKKLPFRPISPLTPQILEKTSVPQPQESLFLDVSRPKASMTSWNAHQYGLPAPSCNGARLFRPPRPIQTTRWTPQFPVPRSQTTYATYASMTLSAFHKATTSVPHCTPVHLHLNTP
jgi:hypothetical protein